MSNRLLVKLRSGDALRAAAVRARLEPLYDRPTPLAAAGGPQWFIVEPAPSATPWEAAHDRLAAQLGVGEDEILFAEPDLIHDIYRDPDENPAGQPFAADETCDSRPQDGTHARPWPGNLRADQATGTDGGMRNEVLTMAAAIGPHRARSL